MDFEPENNLDLTNKAISWGGDSDRTESHRNIGNTAVSSAETPRNATANLNEQVGQSSELGKIIDVNPMPPVPQAEQIEQALNPDIVRFDSKLIKTEGDHVSKATLREVDKAEVKLSQDGNIADFYTTVRNMMEANLDNSYDRKLAAWVKQSVLVFFTTII